MITARERETMGWGVERKVRGKTDCEHQSQRVRKNNKHRAKFKLDPLARAPFPL